MRKICPKCASKVHRLAIVCRFCGYEPSYGYSGWFRNRREMKQRMRQKDKANHFEVKRPRQVRGGYRGGAFVGAVPRPNGAGADVNPPAHSESVGRGDD